MRRAAEYGAGAVAHQDKIRDPDGQGAARVKRVLDGETGIEAELWRRLDGLFARAHGGARGAESGQRVIVFRELQRDRVIG